MNNDDLQRKRQELKETLFNEKNKEKKPVLINIILSFTMVITLGFSAFLIYDSFNHINQVYRIINAILIFITVLSALIAFKKSYQYHKTKSVGLTAISLIILMLFNILTLTSTIKLPTQTFVPNFSNKTLTEALKWTEKNNIKANQTFEYSDLVKKYAIINQDKSVGTLTKNIKEITFEISNGPDYNKEVIISDMTGWNIDDVIKVIDDNLLNNVYVNFEENEDIEKDTVISQNISGNIKRNDKLTLNVSLGNKDALKSIKLKDLKNESVFKATLYLNRHAIDYELKYEFSDKIDKGNVIKSSIKKGTTVSLNDKITLTISKGKKIVVPELKNKKLSYITNWMIENNLKIDYSDKYDDNIKNGYVIEATYKKGDIIEEETTVGITVSKGKLKMENFSSLQEFKTWAEKYNVKYETKEEFNEDIKKGEIIKFSVKKGDIIKSDENIIVYVSKGKEIEMPNFIGETKSNVQNTCNKLNLSCTFTTEYSANDKEGTAINQSIKAKEKVSENTTVKITVATKNKNETKTNSSNNSSKSSSSSNQTNNSNNNSTPITKTVFIQPIWVQNLNGGNSSNYSCGQIKSGIQGQISTKVNIKCTTKASKDGRGSGLMHEDSKYQVGQSYSFTEGQTYEFILVE